MDMKDLNQQAYSALNAWPDVFPRVLTVSESSRAARTAYAWAEPIALGTGLAPETARRLCVANPLFRRRQADPKDLTDGAKLRNSRVSRLTMSEPGTPRACYLSDRRSGGLSCDGAETMAVMAAAMARREMTLQGEC